VPLGLAKTQRENKILPRVLSGGRLDPQLVGHPLEYVADAWNSCIGKQLGGALLGELAYAQLDPLPIRHYRKGNVTIVGMRGRVRGERIAENHRVVQPIHWAVSSDEDHRNHATQHWTTQWTVR
jgi:hypothetical protein